ncbi:TPA: TraR/DksA family transcriptional regulator [Escherichia coli]|uniref:TraR/DksA family transcriptional regulator n=1 Tax=Enterobacteriaceae TaxID=543 RepID=UPI00076F2687|nr:MULTISPECIES: TraR/DksA family transcriptional regulator [Enterobacteriaceae]HCR2102707.1 TraR/DksA family transcriptional regulator [Enterobacter asburiae]EEZ5380712.1 TraR/DksA family transcriptional regulator [Escherichia coli]EFE0688460.1 TraR/DksA family transcriptional regulator [Escherichia coli]EFE0693429.1 TraR/DksA family transcriptional regulator [Escherichia coli]EFN5612682.1 TraR/DksA family transcriptional regulator [Escherichia coli]
MSSDIIDQANELVEHRLQLAIQKHRIDQNAVSAEHCSECEEDIPKARRVAMPGCKTCASCQEVLELMIKQRKG